MNRHARQRTASFVSMTIAMTTGLATLGFGYSDARAQGQSAPGKSAPTEPKKEPAKPTKPKAPPAPQAPSASGPSADQIADRVQKFYDGTVTFQAQFEQVYHIQAYKRHKRSTGRVVFERPGRMSWDYDQPNGNRVVSDGKLLRVYEQDKRQLVEQPLGESQYPAVLSFLIGKGNLKQMFTLNKLDSKTMKFEGGYVLEGTPKQPTSAYNKVIMYIDGDTAQVRRMLIIDAQRNRNLFTFSRVSVNAKLPSSTFAFIPPPGTQIVRR